MDEQTYDETVLDDEQAGEPLLAAKKGEDDEDFVGQNLGL